MCKPCPTPTTTLTTGSTFCSACDVQRPVQANAFKARTGERGYYWNSLYFQDEGVVALETEGQQCTTCCVSCDDDDDGFHCDTRGVRLESLDLKRGWWRATNLSTKAYECDLSSSCEGGNDTRSSVQCSPGYKRLCFPTYMQTQVALGHCAARVRPSVSKLPFVELTSCRRSSRLRLRRLPKQMRERLRCDCVKSRVTGEMRCCDEGRPDARHLDHHLLNCRRRGFRLRPRAQLECDLHAAQGSTQDDERARTLGNARRDGSPQWTNGRSRAGGHRTSRRSRGRGKEELADPQHLDKSEVRPCVAALATNNRICIAAYQITSSTQWVLPQLKYPDLFQKVLRSVSVLDFVDLRGSQCVRRAVDSLATHARRSST